MESKFSADFGARKESLRVLRDSVFPLGYAS